MTERVLVIGGTGCVGWHVCAAFREHGAEVVVAARRPAPDVPADRFVPLDLGTCTGRDLAELFAANRITTVVNAALGWGRDEEEMVALNVRPVQRILEALRDLPTAPRLVQLGTVHEYGPVAPGTAIDERVEARPATSYARAKLAASRLVFDAVRAGSAGAVVLRLTNTIGPRPSMETFFGSLAVRLRDADPAIGLEIPVAEAHRDYVDVRDAAAAVVAVAGSAAADPLVNIGSGQAYSIQRLVDELVAASGLPASAVRAPAGDPNVGSQSAGGASAWVRLDISRARQLLDWRPRRPVEQSLRDLYDSVAATVRT